MQDALSGIVNYYYCYLRLLTKSAYAKINSHSDAIIEESETNLVF